MPLPWPDGVALLGLLIHAVRGVTEANSWPDSKKWIRRPHVRSEGAEISPGVASAVGRGDVGLDSFRALTMCPIAEGSPWHVKTKRPDDGKVPTRALPEVSEQAVRELAQVFKLLSDETRLRILFYLALSPSGELHVTDLCQRLGQSQPAVSHHLALLRVSGLIESRREGKHNFYCVRTDHFGELLLCLFSAAGEVPRNKKYRFHDFTLAYTGA